MHRNEYRHGLCISGGCHCDGNYCHGYFARHRRVRKLKPSIIAILGYVICWYCFGMCLTQIGLGIAYATWGAIGTAATPIIGYFAYQQRTTKIGIFALVLIMVCVVLLNLYG